MTEAACPIARRFVALAARSPRAPALLGPGGETLSDRGALAERAARLGEVFAPVLPRGLPVVLALPNSPELVSGFLALRRAGVPVALVDAVAPAEELARNAATIGAAAVLAPPARVPAGEVVWTGEGAALVLRHDREGVPIPRGTAILKMTSGSTGVPRAVALSVRQLAADTVQIMRTMGVRGDDVTLAAIPLTHSYGLGNCLLPLLLAGTPLAFPTCALPAALADTLTQAAVAHFPAVPAMIRALAKLPDAPRLPHLRVCLAAGAPLQPRDAAAFHAALGHKVHIFYGSSECGGISYDRSAAPTLDEGCVGTPMERVTVDLIDPSGQSVPMGDEGRVRVRSRAVGLGVVPAGVEDGGITAGTFLTGDLGRFDEAGKLKLTGRLSELLNVAGKKVHPDEVRRVLEAVPGVVSAVVTGLPDRHRGELVAALVAVEPGSPLSIHHLLSVCRARLAPHKVPRRLVLVDEMPISDRGKLKKDAVLKLLKERSRVEQIR